MALPSFLDKLIKGGLPAALDFPVVQPTGVNENRTERFPPQDTSARSTVPGEPFGLSLQNMILLGTLGVVTAIGLVAVFK